MKVPFLDLTRQNNQVRARAIELFTQAIDRSAFIGGNAVSDFERNFAAFCGSPYGVAVNSGTDALRLAIAACGVEPGDEIITVPFTFIATAETITQNGCKPVFADIDPASCTMDPARVEVAITERTRGIIPVHLYGHPAPMEALLAIARRHRLWLVEDACQAHGAAIGESKAGSMGTAGTFSFYPTKNMGAFGEGGFVTTADDTIAAKITAYRNHGQSARYAHEFEGFNARLDAVQAAVLDEKLKLLPAWNLERQGWADVYRRELAGVGDLILPAAAPGITHAWHLFTIRTSCRDALRRHLDENGIGTAVHYPTPLHQQKAYAHLGYRADDFPVSMECARTVLSLPLFQGISAAEVDAVIRAVKQFFADGHHSIR